MGDRKGRALGTRIAIVIGAVIVFLGIVAGTARSDDYYQEQERTFLNGDVNGDGQICFDDTMGLVYHLFRDGRELPCPAAADYDGSKCVDINDVVYGLRYLFFGGVYLSGSIPESECIFPTD